jgi:hypothetical protein
VQQFNLKSDLRKGDIRLLFEAIARKQLHRLLLIQDLPKTQHTTRIILVQERHKVLAGALVQQDICITLVQE